MSLVLILLLFVPVVAFFMSALLDERNEKAFAYLALGLTGLHFLATALVTFLWVQSGTTGWYEKVITLYQTSHFEFSIAWTFDRITAVFALVGSFLTFLVAQFSRFYLHRDPGFKRFFCTLLLFFAGYNLVVFSGNLETLFLGWEALGITSFLLIAFYRERYLPVRNAFKVLSFYRLADVLLMLAMWMLHHCFHKNATFAEMAIGFVPNHQGDALLYSAGICIVLAALIKSAQFPFMTWLPRAMEGPTASSAIFYGALAVHIGVFLLLRTAPIWEAVPYLKYALGFVGLLTAFVAHQIGSVQATVKTKIAYASIAQIGFMVVEVAAGLHVLALFHFVCNACLRAYQFLVSPSVLSYLGHEMVFHPHLREVTPAGAPAASSWKSGIYLLSLKEWNLDGLLRNLFWKPFKSLGGAFQFLGTTAGMVMNAVLIILSFVLPIFATDLTSDWSGLIPIVMSVFGIVLILAAFAHQADAQSAWNLTFTAQLALSSAMLWNHETDYLQLLLYIAGPLLAYLLGSWVLSTLARREGAAPLTQYHGLAYEYPDLALLFLLACLAFSGFPITPSFIGVDLMFSQIGVNQIGVIAAWALHFIFVELALIRLYARVFLGQHTKEYHPVAYKSS
jgi:NADH-quinone oxidoreductase subunit L